MSNSVTVYCPLCGAAETAQVRVSSFRTAKDGRIEVTLEPTDVAHVCPAALADHTPDNSRDDIRDERRDVHPEG